MKKVFSIICTFYIILLSFGLTACNNQKQYSLTVTGSELLYENLNATYAAGEVVTVKTRIKPYEGVKVALDTKQLVKTKSTQNEFWQFKFEMPSHDAMLDITSYKGWDEPLLYGFYLTFYDKNGDPIEAFNKPIDSKEAIADYATIYYEDGHKIFSSNDGANVFAERKIKIGDSFELEDTLYYTYELLDAVVVVDWVHVDDLTHVYSYGSSTGNKLDDIGGIMSLSTTQNLSDTLYNSQMKEYEQKFDSFVKISFVYLDYLTGVKVLEFNANNELIKTADIGKPKSELTHNVSENCEYVIIEEEYTPKDGIPYYERTLINKNNKSESGKMLKYPRGDGLISPVYLSVKW